MVGNVATDFYVGLMGDEIFSTAVFSQSSHLSVLL